MKTNNPYYVASWKNPQYLGSAPATGANEDAPSEQSRRPWYSDERTTPPGAAFIGCFWSMIFGAAITIAGLVLLHFLLSPKA